MDTEVATIIGVGDCMEHYNLCTSCITCKLQ